MRTSVVFAVVLCVACIHAAPALERLARQTEDTTSEALLMGRMRSGISVLRDFSKYNLSVTLGINSSLNVFDFDTGNRVHEELREAINTTCKLFEAQNTLAKISLEDQVAYEILTIMSSKSLEDACLWTSSILSDSFHSSYNVQCENSTITDICAQWNDIVAIRKIESKVDILRKALGSNESDRNVNVTQWINRQNFPAPFNFLNEKYDCTTVTEDGAIWC